MKTVVEVALGLPIPKTFHYRIPEAMAEWLQPGMRVLVPFKGRKVTGFTLDLADRVPEGLDEKLKEVEEVLDDAPILDAPLLRFFRWISDYYLHPLGEVIKTGLPPGLLRKSESILSLTPEGQASLAEGRLDPFAERVLAEVDRCGKSSLKGILKAFHKEATRDRIFALKRRGLLAIEPGFEGRGVQPKFEKVIRFLGRPPAGLRSKKQADVLAWIMDQKEIPYTDVAARFKAPSQVIRSLTEKGCIALLDREVCRGTPVHPEFKPYLRPGLTPDQERVFREISDGVRSRRFSPFLLHGVTGSGKTEIYLRAIEETLNQGRNAIVLVPEISLTPQILSRFKDRFGENLALLHSELRSGERYDQWRRILRGEVGIVIGARSALFAPFRDLGIIVVDEEHEPSYKQEEKLKYHARDLAVVRARDSGATLILGSATPSLESYSNAQSGKFRLLTLPRRIEGRPLPPVEVVDMKKEKGLLSERMREALQKNIAEGKQSLLFLNRRGFSRFILCPDCGFTFKCPNCSVTLTHHLREHLLRCHYCNYRIPAPGSCPNCHGDRIRGVGTGTERLEQEIQSLFPGLKVERMDRDTTSRRQSHREILKRFENGQTHVLVGTQMIVKGHDFPNVTFVGVVSADTSLHFPDFRASERTFQLLTQVAGRAGRGDAGGIVLIQTYSSDHYSILRAMDHDFVNFCQEELQFRKALHYPPYSRLINFRMTGNHDKKVESVAREIGRTGQSLLREGYAREIELLGPSMAPYSKMRGRFRWQMLAKGKSPRSLHQFSLALSHLEGDKARGKGVTLDIDVDPVFIL